MIACSRYVLGRVFEHWTWTRNFRNNSAPYKKYFNPQFCDSRFLLLLMEIDIIYCRKQRWAVCSVHKLECREIFNTPVGSRDFVLDV